MQEIVSEIIVIWEFKLQDYCSAVHANRRWRERKILLGLERYKSFSHNCAPNPRILRLAKSCTYLHCSHPLPSRLVPGWILFYFGIALNLLFRFVTASTWSASPIGVWVFTLAPTTRAFAFLGYLRIGCHLLVLLSFVEHVLTPTSTCRGFR